jgi:hypothetical protein
VNSCRKQSSFLRYGNNYCCKKFYSTDPRIGRKNRQKNQMKLNESESKKQGEVGQIAVRAGHVSVVCSKVRELKCSWDSVIRIFVSWGFVTVSSRTGTVFQHFI